MGPSGTVVITGASRGIGRACAIHLDRVGFTVVAGVRREEDGIALRTVASSRLRPVHLDVTDAGSIAAAAAAARDIAGEERLVGLVNNAGIAVAGPLEFIPLAEVRRQLEVNVVGLLAVTQACLPLLRPGGRIVNVSSASGRVATPFTGPYAASKFAVEALSDALRMELARWGVRVSVIEPGPVSTAIWDSAIARYQEMADRMPSAAQERYGRALAAKERHARRMPQLGMAPERVARAVGRALTARRPRARYPVGGVARLASVVRLLPARLADKLVGG